MEVFVEGFGYVWEPHARPLKYALLLFCSFKSATGTENQQ